MQFDKLCKRLIVREPFWGIIMLGINKRFSNDIDTMCVSKLGISLELKINREFWEGLTDDEQLACLLHELHHLCFNHPPMYKDFPDKDRLQIAADLEVNCYIQNLPKWACRVEMFGFPERQGLKWYYENLKGKVSRQGGTVVVQTSGNGNQNNEDLDDHNSWKDFCECSEAQKELIQSHIDGLIKAAAEHTMKQRGTIPAYLQERIDELLKERPRIYDWKAQFRRMLGSEIEVKFKKTYQRESKRFRNCPGIKMKRRISIMVGIDTSGSVSDKELSEFFSEIMHIYRAGARVHIVECDAVITKEWDFTGFQNVTISGRGGTDFAPVIDYYREHRKEYTALVFFTDGYAPVDNLNVSNNDMTWVITSGGERKKYPGKVIYIPADNSEE